MGAYRVHDDDGVGIEVVVGNQLPVIEQVNIRHLGVVLRHVLQAALGVTDGVIRKVADQSAREIGELLKLR